MCIALADDDVLLREGLASLLERSGFDVVGHRVGYLLESPVVDVVEFIETVPALVSRQPGPVTADDRRVLGVITYLDDR